MSVASLRVITVKSIDILEPTSKSGFWFKIKADARFNPEEYFQYFEDLNRVPNAEPCPPWVGWGKRPF
jgi:hypothetical protein